jgi:hypothetical protein
LRKQGCVFGSYCSYIFSGCETGFLLFTVFGGVVLVAIGQQQQENGRKRVDITLNKNDRTSKQK